MNCHSSAEKLIVNFSKEMLILQPRFYILNFNETKSVNSLSSDKQLKFKLAVYLGGKVMVSAQSSNLVRTHSLLMMRSFLIWTFTLAVCLLVVGFPLVVLMATVGCLLSIVLQSVIPASAVLVVAGGLVMFNVMAVLVTAGVLTAKGIHPKEIKWLNWLHDKGEKAQTTVYAACPLTCEINQ
jgi:hypothetical protein